MFIILKDYASILELAPGAVSRVTGTSSRLILLIVVSSGSLQALKAMKMIYS